MTLTTTTITTTTATLGIGNGHSLETLHGPTFGALAQLAWPHLDSYHGDLFHDAGWLRKYMVGDAETFGFNFAVGGGGFGTRIGMDDYILDGPQIGWRVVVSKNDKGAWTFCATEQA